MENFRLFLIRVLQVAWVLVALLTISALFIEWELMATIEVLLLLGIPTLIIQFLIFADPNPLNLFNNKIKENLIN